MEENIIVVGKSGYVKKIFGGILLAPVIYFYIMGFIIYFTAGTADAITPIFILSIPFLLIALACFRQSSSITVTDKRVFGQITKWIFSTRRLDLPLDSISSVETGFNSIRVSTSSGYIAFKGITNQYEVASAINSLLMARQDVVTSVITHEPQPSIPNELKQYKELLDGGVITQEEFDEKKRRLLGL